MYQSFEDLEVWKRSCRLAVSVYQQLEHCRDFGLKDQMTRAAVSIASNISEGSERSSTPDFIRFLNIAKGSAAELRTQVYIAEQVGVLTHGQEQALIVEFRGLSAMLHGLVKALKSQSNLPSANAEN